MNGNLTIERNVGNALSNQVLEAIEIASNDMAYVFKGNKTTYTPVDSIDLQDTWYRWERELVDESEKSISIELPKGKKLRFMKVGNCIGVVVDKYSYIEYYCKTS